VGVTIITWVDGHTPKLTLLPF